MTVNFKILSDFVVSQEQVKIIEKINSIEESMMNDKLDYIYLDGRKLLELLLSDDYDNFKSLDDVIKDLRIHKALPSKVLNALFTIKKKGNEGTHAMPMLSDQPYMMNLDVFSCVEFLKHIFIVIKYFAKERNPDTWKDDYATEYVFNSNIYLPNFKMNNANDTTSIDVKPETEALESKLKGIFELINSDYSFLIPTFQRAYTWNKESVLVFLQDILDRSKDKQTHYLGSLAIAIDNKNKILRIIDGQQRITTSLLLIKVMIDKFESTKSLNLPKELEAIKDKLHQKYKNDASVYGELHFVKKILSNNFTSDKAFTNSIAYKNYLTIQEFIFNLSNRYFDEFYTTFIYHFVIAELRFKNDLEQEIQIFENLNSKGTALSQWDLIKNYIYKNLDINFLLTSEKEVDVLLNDLFVIKSNIAFKNKKFDKLSDFFIIYSRIRNKFQNGQILSNKGKVHKIFATLWPQTKNKTFTSIEDLQKSLLLASKYFEIYTILESKTYLKPDSPLFEFRLHLENTSIKDAHYPMLINLIELSGKWNLNDLEGIKKDKFLPLFTLISDVDKYITRLIVVNNIGQSLSAFLDQTITNSIQDTHSIFLRKILEKGKGTSLPSQEDFKIALEEKNDWQNKYALSVLRTFNQKHPKSNKEKHIFASKASLEHIFPQKPLSTSEWFNNSGVSWDKFLKIYPMYLNKLGNYLILSQKLNAKVKNKNDNFAKKIEVYVTDKDSKQIIGTSDGMLMNLTTKSAFSFEDIDKRTKQLAALIAPFYKLSNNE